jgi:hypothetical protein
MVRLLIVLACLAFILSLGTGSVAHAVASIDCSATSPTIAVEDGAEEGRSLPADPKKACHHNHCGCHGHHLAALPATRDLPIARASPPDMFIHTAKALNGCATQRRAETPKSLMIAAGAPPIIAPLSHHRSSKT